MDIVHYFSNNHDQLFYLLAGLSFIIELTVMGLGGPLLFIAIACFITGFFISMNWINGWEAEVFTLGLVTAVTALIFWKPLKSFQNAGGGPDTSSDMIGQRVPVSSDITVSGGSIRHSGINWNSRLSRNAEVEVISVNSMCIIESVEGNVMIVKPDD
jgi:membrane protein implicated in regulation of membrane protease activity